MNPIRRTFPRGRHVTDSGAIVCIGTFPTFPTFRDVPSAVTIGVKADKAWTTHSVATDPNVWSNRAIQEGFGDLPDAGSCINVSGLCLERVLSPGHHGYQGACDLISGQASNGPFGSPVFACAGKTDSPSSHPLADLGGQTETRLSYVIDSSSFCAVPLFVPCGRSFVPASACRRTARKGPSRLAVALALPLASTLPATP
jgi:hypothetical protein